MNRDMNELIDDVPKKENQPQFTLKVLFGPLFGCELNLLADDYFLIINPGLSQPDTSTIEEDNTVYHSKKILYLPFDIPSPNVILNLSSPLQLDDGNEGYKLDIQSVENSFTTLIKSNEVFSYEKIRFAIKYKDDEWQEHIKNFSLESALPLPQNVNNVFLKFNRVRKYQLFGCSMIILTLLITSCIIWYKKQEDERKVLTLQHVLASAPTKINIIRDRNNSNLYLITDNYQTTEWTREALTKLKESNTAEIIWLPEYRARIISELNKLGFPVLQIDFSVPKHPVITLYRNLSHNEDKIFTPLVLKKLPFAVDLKTSIKTKRELLQIARQGLDRLHLYYRQINTVSGYALVIHDALSDSALNALQDFINKFNQQWGAQGISFSINLDDNWLNNKSYLDSNNGYLFLNPLHWYFPLKGKFNE